MADFRIPPPGNPGFVDDARASWDKTQVNLAAPPPSPPPPPTGALVAAPFPSYGYAGAGGPPQLPALVSGKKNWMGITSLVLGLLGFALIGLVLGISGLNAVKRGEANNRGIALAGVIINSAIFGILALIVMIAGVMGAVGPERTDILKLGQCFDEPRMYTEDGNEVVDTYTLRSCDEPHFGEVYYVGRLTDITYPGVSAVEAQVDEACYLQAEYNLDFDNVDFQYYSYYYPTLYGFKQGQRTYECYVYADYEIVGSVRLNR